MVLIFQKKEKVYELDKTIVRCKRIKMSSSRALLTAKRFVWLSFVLERFSIEFRKTKTKAITTANHNTRKQHNEPMKTKSKYT